MKINKKDLLGFANGRNEKNDVMVGTKGGQGGGRKWRFRWRWRW